MMMIIIMMMIMMMMMSRGRYTVTFAPEKHIITSEQGLVVISISEADSGRYDCVHRGQLVSR